MSYFIDKENIIDHKGAKEAIAEVKAALGGLKDEITAIKDLTKVLKENNTTLNGLANANKKVTETDSNVIEIKKRLKESIVAYAKEVEKAAKENEKYYAKLEKESKAAAQAAAKAEQERIKGIEAAAKREMELNAQSLKIRTNINKEKIASEKAAAQAAAKAAQTTRNTLKTTRTERMQLILAMNSEKGSATQLAAVNKVLESRMKQLNPLIAEQKIQYDKLNNAVINNSKMMSKHRADMRAMGSGFNGLQFQVTQLARELPALAYGPQMFIAAISNNFPMLQDEIKKAKLEMLDLKNKGKETVPIWKQMTKAILSWQTAIIILITAYMMFSKEINKAIASVFSYNKGINIAKETQKSLNKALDEGTKSAGDEIAKLKTLYTISQDETRTREDRLGAVNELQEIYPSYLKNIDDEAFLIGGAYQQYQLLTRAILDNAIAKAKLNEITEIGASIYEEEKKYFKLIDELSKKEKALASEEVFAGSQEADELLEMEIKSLRKKRDKSLAIIGDYAEQANNIMSTIKSADLIEDDKKQKEKSQKDSDWILNMFREMTKQEIEIFKQAKESEIKQQEYTEDQIKMLREKYAIEVLAMELDYMKKEQMLVKENGLEYNKIQSDIEAKRAELLDATNTFNAQRRDEYNELMIKNEKDTSDAFVNQMYYRADVAKKTAAQSTLTSIREEKKKKREIEKLKRELALYEIRIEIEAAKTIIESIYTTTDEKAKQLARLEQLYADFYKKQIDNEDQNNDDLEKGFSEWARAVADIYTELFNIINSLYERQLQAAENVYKSESKYAGESVEQRIQAEDKYDKKQREIKRKQAAAQKLQSAFNVILGSYEYVVKALAGDPIAIAQVIASGLALTAIAAEPIPAFAKGGSHKEGMARVSEKGSELFIDKKGKMYLTPDKETVAHFPSGEFIPHDETQRMLANFAMRNDREIVDMTNTNRYLRNIDKNTRNQQTIDFIGGYKIIKRNGITSKIRI